MEKRNFNIVYRAAENLGIKGTEVGSMKATALPTHIRQIAAQDMEDALSAFHTDKPDTDVVLCYEVNPEGRLITIPNE